jgi:hypothetical protein
MISNTPSNNTLSPETQQFYCDAMRLLARWEIPFLVGGAYALAQRTGIVRHTKDFDLFLLPEDVGRALRAFELVGFRAELMFEHWLGKVYQDEDYIDLIFSSGNGLCRVDASWFVHSAEANVFGQATRLCPVEETIWQKAFICERERFDGADVNHLLLAFGRELDWARLLNRFGKCWPVLLAHLILFGFVYPSEEEAVPRWVLEELTGRLRDQEPIRRRVCQGTLLSRTQYVRAVEDHGYADARVDVEGGMTADQAVVWTDAGLNGQQVHQKEQCSEAKPE